MTRRATHRAAAVTTALLLTATLGACGGEDEAAGQESSGPSASSSPSPSPSGSPTASEPADPGSSSSSAGLVEALADPGDDLLDGARRGAVFEGTDVELSWRFPEGWETTDGRSATLDDPATGPVDIAVGAKPGVTRTDDAAALGDAVGPDVTTEVQEVEVRGVPFSLVTQEADDIAAHFLLWSPDGEQVTYAVILYGPPPLADTPPELLSALAQVAGSLEYGDEPL